MTKVLSIMVRGAVAVVLATTLCASPLVPAAGSSEGGASRPAEALYLELGRVGLDPARVFQVREASLDRSSVHITLQDGTIAFTKDVMGRITGAFFEGDGEVLLVPPNVAERKSLSLFTGMAILEERFTTAYLRFNDDTAAELRPNLRATDNAQEFAAQWDETASNLARLDRMRLLMTFSQLLPVIDDPGAHAGGGAAAPSTANDHMLHARVQGTKLGIFDVYFDTMAEEPVQAGQARTAENGNKYYDTWTAFSPRTAGGAQASSLESERPREDSMVVRRFAIQTEVTPPKEIHAEAHLQLEVRQGGSRALIFELSRFLQIESVEMNGSPVEFIHNPAVEGTQLSRTGNDLVAVVLPAPAQSGQKIELRFIYGGEVLAEAGNGLLYVGARGTWYPNRGLAMADFDLEFDYPAGWTLVATGKAAVVNATRAPTAAGGQRARWVSERPIPLAGFNLGKYRLATAQAGDVTVETYATLGMEKDFPTPPVQIIETNPFDPLPRRRGPRVIAPVHPSPVRSALPLAEVTARAIRYYAERFGPFPYSHLALTQMPGHDSQGWPGLVFLSSYVFLEEEDRAQLHVDPVQALVQQQIPAHEAAHQWWGDLITWSSYRDQWISEGLANYSALMMLQGTNPAGFRQVMRKYRDALLEKDKTGAIRKDAGPVTLGGRLLSSHFPEGYEAISYGRGTWLFHMLRTMLQDALQQSGRRGKPAAGPDEPFVRALRRVRQRYEGRSISTKELLDVFAEDLPPALRYEGKSGLEWFLEGWINGTAVPKLELKAVKITSREGAAMVSGTIVQKDCPEDLVTSIPIYATAAGKQPILLGRVFADGEESSFHLSAPAGTRKVVLDPYETILTNAR